MVWKLGKVALFLQIVRGTGDPLGFGMCCRSTPFLGSKEAIANFCFISIPFDILEERFSTSICNQSII